MRKTPTPKATEKTYTLPPGCDPTTDCPQVRATAFALARETAETLANTLEVLEATRGRVEGIADADGCGYPEDHASLEGLLEVLSRRAQMALRLAEGIAERIGE